MSKYDRQGAILRLVQQHKLSTQQEVAAALDAGLLVGSAGETVLRLTPPLTITGDEVAAGLTLLEEVLR